VRSIINSFMETPKPSEIQSPDTPLEVEPSPPAKHHSKKRFIIAGSVLLIVVIIAGIWIFHGKPSKPKAALTLSHAQSGVSTSSGNNNFQNVSVKLINLTGIAPQGLAIDPKTGYVYTGNNGLTTAAKCSESGSTTAPSPSPSPSPNPGPPPAGNNAPPPQNNNNPTPPSSANAGSARNSPASSTSPGANTMSIVNPSIMKEIARVDTHITPIWPLVDDARGVVYVASSGAAAGGYVDVFSLNTGQKVAAISVGGTAHDLGLDSSTGILIVSNTYDTSQTYYSVINVNTRTVIAHYQVPSEPHGIVVDAVNHVAYMATVGDGEIAVIDMKTGQLKTTFSTGSKIFRSTNLITFSPKERKIFLVDSGVSQATTGQPNQPTQPPQPGIDVFSADNYQLLGKIPMEAIPWGITVDDSTHLIYAALPDDNAVGIANIDTLKTLGYFSTGSGTCPFAVRLDATRNLGFTSNTGNNTLGVFSVAQVDKDIKH